MRKDPTTMLARAEYVQKCVNERHKSLNVNDVVATLAKELFLSETTIWGDLAKTLKNEEQN